MFRVETKGDVAVLRMDDGKVNAMGPAFVQAFGPALQEAADKGRAIVIAGNAKAFCAGLDLKTLPTLERPELLAFGRGFMGAFGDVLACPRPLVAAVDGPALAGGAILALACDLRHVGERARLGLTEVPVGIPFPAPVADLAIARLPPQEHAPALLQGAVRAGAECVSTGWAHVHAADPVASAIEAAATLAEHHPPAVASAKRALRGRLADDFAAFANKEADAWVDLVMAEDTIEAIVRSFARATKK